MLTTMGTLRGGSLCVLMFRVPDDSLAASRVTIFAVEMLPKNSPKGE